MIPSRDIFALTFLKVFSFAFYALALCAMWAMRFSSDLPRGLSGRQSDSFTVLFTRGPTTRVYLSPDDNMPAIPLRSITINFSHQYTLSVAGMLLEETVTVYEHPNDQLPISAEAHAAIIARVDSALQVRDFPPMQFIDTAPTAHNQRALFVHWLGVLKNFLLLLVTLGYLISLRMIPQAFREARGRRRAFRCLCPHCGYPIKGLKTETCPECGEHLDLMALRNLKSPPLAKEKPPASAGGSE